MMHIMTTSYIGTLLFSRSFSNVDMPERGSITDILAGG